MPNTTDAYSAGGTTCPALDKITNCNLHKCPIVYRVGEWSGCVDCSAKCGGGTLDRNRPVYVRLMYNGVDCGDSEETQSYNPQSCDAECVSRECAAWSICSKTRSQGHITRFRNVLDPAIGGSTCADIGGPVCVQEQLLVTKALVLFAVGQQGVAVMLLATMTLLNRNLHFAIGFWLECVYFGNSRRLQHLAMGRCTVQFYYKEFLTGGETRYRIHGRRVRQAPHPQM